MPAIPPVAAPIVTLADVKAHLRISGTGDDASLTALIGVASQMWVNRCGPAAGSPVYDEWHDGGRPQIVVRHAPVQSVTAIHESYGTQLTYTLVEEVLDNPGSSSAYGYSLDYSTGILTRRAAGVAVPFATGLQNIHVTYVAGYATTPADIVFAIKLIVQHMYESERGGSRRPGMGETQQPAAGALYAWPARAEEIAAAYYVPGVA